MTRFVTIIKEVFGGRKEKTEDPVYNFFFETSSRDRKRVYSNALKKAQVDQEKVLRIAKENARA
ncbi:MAG: hypothetical protein KBC35_03460 [Candidatus Pacebacteria bacterium]|nr:hypothetical protein [Candidatus Paceibacterota bacterium]